MIVFGKDCVSGALTDGGWHAEEPDDINNSCPRKRLQAFRPGGFSFLPSMEPPNRSPDAATQIRSSNTQATETTTFFPN